MDIDRELLEQFEYTLPVIKSNVDTIDIETAQDYHGEILLRNAGGSVLEGSVASNIPALTFTPGHFTGNRVSIMFKFSIDMYGQGDAVHSDIIITSNGGELIIPVNITVATRSFAVSDGVLLNSAEDFMIFARDFPAEAARAFVRKDFSEWLSGTGCEHMELYEHFRFDANKERAIDNFLYLHGLKAKASLSLEESETEISVIPGRKESLPHTINVIRDGWGFADADIYVPGKPTWLNLITTRLTLSSFSRDGTAQIDYVVFPELINAPRVMAEIRVKPPDKPELCHKLFVKYEPFFKARLGKSSFGFNDTGHISIINNTGGDLVVEIFPVHDFIRLEGRRYLIGAKADIPFDVKLTPARLSQLAEKNSVVIETSLLVKTVFNKTIFTRTLNMGVTDLKGYL